MIKYQNGILAFDLRFIKNDPSAIKGKKNWEKYGKSLADDFIETDADPREIFIQAKRALAVLTHFISGLSRYTDGFFDKSDESFLGAKIAWRNTIGGGVQYKQNENYQKMLEEVDEMKEGLQSLIRQATKESRIKDQNKELWQAEWYSPITGEEFVLTEDDAVPQTGREGFVYYI